MDGEGGHGLFAVSYAYANRRASTGRTRSSYQGRRRKTSRDPLDPSTPTLWYASLLSCTFAAESTDRHYPAQRVICSSGYQALGHPPQDSIPALVPLGISRALSAYPFPLLPILCPILHGPLQSAHASIARREPVARSGGRSGIPRGRETDKRCGGAGMGEEG